MKKLFGVFLVFGMLCLTALATGCGGVDLYMYIFAGEYRKIEQNATFDNVKELEVQWLSGELKIVSGDVEHITLKESGNEVSKKPAYYRQREDGHMTIMYFKSGEIRNVEIKKQLVITVPRDALIHKCRSRRKLG